MDDTCLSWGNCESNVTHGGGDCAIPQIGEAGADYSLQNASQVRRGKNSVIYRGAGSARWESLEKPADYKSAIQQIENLGYVTVIAALSTKIGLLPKMWYSGQGELPIKILGNKPWWPQLCEEPVPRDWPESQRDSPAADTACSV